MLRNPLFQLSKAAEYLEQWVHGLLPPNSLLDVSASGGSSWKVILFVDQVQGCLLEAIVIFFWIQSDYYCLICKFLHLEVRGPCDTQKGSSVWLGPCCWNFRSKTKPSFAACPLDFSFCSAIVLLQYCPPPYSSFSVNSPTNVFWASQCPLDSNIFVVARPQFAFHSCAKAWAQEGYCQEGRRVQDQGWITFNASDGREVLGKRSSLGRSPSHCEASFEPGR